MSEYEDSKTLCCLCCETGPITAKLRVDRMGHVCGEAIIPKGEVINKSSRDIRLLTLKLIQECTYKANNPYTRTKRTYKTLVQIQLGRLEEKKNMQLGGTKLIVPPAPPSGLDGCEIIGMHYFVNVISPSGMGFDLVVGVPVIIGTIPLESTVEQYGVPPPIEQSTLVTPSGHGPEPPALVLPSNIPAPSYAQSNFGSIFDEEDKQALQKSETSGNAVGPAQEENTWTPSYSYYNWN
ncbi:hypothetical protein FSP39_021371 [Pinctada imbricata]|uniref:Arrestin C-terminal-like domain-containing protein n=1 Tax=Pinctada imbricata TaxID=66713 RepID=A0AA88Y5M4_PINIB|nr:hypothetical protein FSP39_021371 [Pinctada imbricata]